MMDYPRKKSLPKLPMGASAGCAAQNEIQVVTVLGRPDDDTFALGLTINEVTESITINYDDTAEEVTTALEGHSEATEGDFAVSGGPFPNASMVIEFQGHLAGTNIGVMTADWNDLSGGLGVGVLVTIAQQGRAAE